MYKLLDCGKVMLSVMCLSLCLSTGEWGSYVTITHDALDLTTQGPPSLALVKIYFFCPLGHQTWDLLPQAHPSLTNIWWPSLETSSNLFTWDPHPQEWRLVTGHWSTSGFQAGNTHPTGMLSWFLPTSREGNIFQKCLSVCGGRGVCLQGGLSPVGSCLLGGLPKTLRIDI